MRTALALVAATFTALTACDGGARTTAKTAGNTGPAPVSPDPDDRDRPVERPLAANAEGPSFGVSLPETVSEPVDGRVLVILAAAGPDETRKEPRFRVGTGVDAAQVFGLDVEGFTSSPRKEAVLGLGIGATEHGYPLSRSADIPPGRYDVQAVLHRYETFTLASGATVKLPMDRGEGQKWNRAPGNLYSAVQTIELQPGPRPSGEPRISLVVDQTIPPIEPPKDTAFIKHIRIRSERLSKFWGRDMYLGAHVLLPAGFEEHPEARYPLAVFHGHFHPDFRGFRPEPPDPDLKPDFSARFNVKGYNRIVQQEAHDFYKAWTGPDFPRMLIVDIQHANPYYDDSYAVNSANVGPYGDAIQYELIPYIEQRFRGLGEGWARFLYGGSTGGWEALAVQIFYPDEYNGAFAACPDPIDFRANTLVDIYDTDRQPNAYYAQGPFRRALRPGHRDSLGRVDRMLQHDNLLELALGTHSRSGGQFDIWEAVYSPAGDDGYPRPLWDKRTGVIDPEVAAHWREHYDLRHILARDWKTLGPKLRGKIHIYVGDMDNYYLNNAVYLMEEFLESTTDPPYEGSVRYGDRAEHCWNGDPEQPNHISRLRYNTMYVPKILARIEQAAPAGADLKSWRY